MAGYPLLAPPQTPRDDDLVNLVVQTKEAQVINNALQHSRYSSSNSQTYGLQATAAFPLILLDQLLGVFNIALDDRHTFHDGDLRILRLIADQAVIALQNARLYQSVADKEIQLNKLLQKLAIVQEAERRLVGLDLHDGLTQILLSANLHFNTLSLLLKNIDPASQTELQLGQNRLQEAIEEVNWVISELRPTELEDFGLADGLRHYVNKVAQTKGWQTTFSADLNRLDVNPTLETAVFRITQEALSNARKYAKTDRIEVRLSIIEPEKSDRQRTLIVEIQDWGCGFDVSQLKGDMERLGLLGMQERAELLGGTFKIESTLGQGTTIQACIPLDRTKENLDRLNYG